MLKKITFFLTMGIVFGAQLGYSQCTEPFFSEYIEGSSNNKALEIYNPSDVAIDLSNYTIYRYGNGSATPTDTFELSGMLAASDVHVTANAGADSVILSVADDSLSFPSPITFNGDDAVGLLNESSGMLVDVIGEIGVDPGSNWPVGTGSTANFTLVRMPSINEGSTDWTTGATEWIVLPINTFDSLGAHTMNPCSVTGGGSGCTTDIFFSEYIEGSSNNKGLEIFNPSDTTVDLSGYHIFESGNGGSFTDTFFLSGMLAPGDVYVLVTDQADSIMQAQADTILSFPSVTHFNGDDALAIVNMNTGDTTDIIGVIGVDPGSSWPVGTGATANFTLVRMPSVNEGTTDWALSSTQWMVFPQNTYDSLGAHSMNPCTSSSGTGCTTDIFFSEYIEGSSNNKGLEIFNPSDTTVDLSGYHIFESGNGGSFTDTFFLSGMLAPGDVYVLVTDQADSIMQAQADTILSFPSVTHFNGDDALAIVNMTNSDTTDIIGVIGIDPGSSWPVGSGSTANFTLVRMPSVNEGTTDWALSSTQWLVFPQNTYDSLGAHYMIPCNAPAPDSATASFVPTFADVSEGAGIATLSISLLDPGPDTVAVDVMFDMGASTATMGVDFMWSDTTIVFPANAMNPITLDVVLVDDADVEGDETVVVNLMNATNGAKIGAGTFTLTIQDNDYLQYPIGLVTNDADGDGLGDSLGVRCQVQGIVHGIDLQGGSSVQFTMIDSTGGITIFSGNDFGYTVNEGDEVLVQGTITHFNGLTEFSPPDNIILLSQGNPTVTPIPVTVLDETTESELVTLECVTLIDTSQWPTSGGSVNMDVTNGVDTFAVRIDSDVDINGTPVPTAKWLNITGIGGQFDNAAPYTEGYQLLPRYQADVVERGAPSVTFAAGAADVDESAGTFSADVYQADGNPDTTMVTVELDTSSTATAGVDFMWNDTTIMLTGCGGDSVSLPLDIVDDSDVEGDETVVLIITTVTNDASVSIEYNDCYDY